MRDELKQAVIDESLLALRKKRKKTREVFEREILAECEHLAKTMPVHLVQALLTDHLSDLVGALVRKQVAELDVRCRPK
jgi:hypothetical protein